MSFASSKKILNPRLAAMLFLGFSSGLPFALTGSTLQAWFSSAQISIATIGALSLIGIPYTLKFFWAPIMDHYGFSYLGRRRGWMLLTQFAVVLSLLFLAQLDPAYAPGMVGVIALLLAFCSASQDIAIDAYRTDILKSEERGLGASYFVFAYRIAVLLSGGFALVLADYWGFKITYEIMAGLILLSMIPAFFSPSVLEEKPRTENVFKTMFAAWFDILQREKVFLLLAFVILYKFGDALAFALMTNFLLNGLGFNLTEIGLAYKIVSFVAVILGGFVGGIILLRWNIFQALLVFGLAQAFSNLLFAVLALVGKNFWFMALTIFIENFCSGLSTAAFFAFLMSLCNHQFSAAQYAMLSAIASVGRVFLGPVAAAIVAYFGWVQLYVWSFVLCFPSFWLLFLLKDKVLTYAPVGAK